MNASKIKSEAQLAELLEIRGHGKYLKNICTEQECSWPFFVRESDMTILLGTIKGVL